VGHIQVEFDHKFGMAPFEYDVELPEGFFAPELICE